MNDGMVSIKVLQMEQFIKWVPLTKDEDKI
jgi:hypothetical protein